MAYVYKKKCITPVEATLLPPYSLSLKGKQTVKKVHSEKGNFLAIIWIGDFPSIRILLAYLSIRYFLRNVKWNWMNVKSCKAKICTYENVDICFRILKSSFNSKWLFMKCIINQKLQKLLPSIYTTVDKTTNPTKVQIPLSLPIQSKHFFCTPLLLLVLILPHVWPYFLHMQP